MSADQLSATKTGPLERTARRIPGSRYGLTASRPSTCFIRRYQIAVVRTKNIHVDEGQRSSELIPTMHRVGSIRYQRASVSQ